METPAGTIALTCAVEDVEPRLLRRSGTSAIVEHWSVPTHLDVVVVLADVDPPLGQGHGPVDGYLGVVWSFRAHRPCGPIKVGAHLLDATARDFVDGNNGEWLEAVTYDSSTLALSMGTHDDEILRARAGRRPDNPSASALPSSWAPLLEDAWHGEFGARGDALGVVVHMPALGAGERADLHIAVAWGPAGADVATWFAVDTAPDQNLAAVAESDLTDSPFQLHWSVERVFENCQRAPVDSRTWRSRASRQTGRPLPTLLSTASPLRSTT